MRDLTNELVEFIRRTSTDLPKDVEERLKAAVEKEAPGSAARGALETILKKKDFVDLSFLLERYSLAKIIDGAAVKYPGVSLFAICKGLVYFEDAEDEPMPRMLIPRSWEEVKRLVSDAVEGFIKG